MSYLSVLGRLGLAALGPMFMNSTADAQTLNVPQGYMWSSVIPNGFDYASNPMIRPMVHISTSDNLQLADGYQYFVPDTLDPIHLNQDTGGNESGASMTGRYAGGWPQLGATS